MKKCCIYYYNTTTVHDCSRQDLDCHQPSFRWIRKTASALQILGCDSRWHHETRIYKIWYRYIVYSLIILSHIVLAKFAKTFWSILLPFQALSGINLCHLGAHLSILRCRKRFRGSIIPKKFKICFLLLLIWGHPIFLTPYGVKSM
jgi:hypothetical protein